MDINTIDNLLNGIEKAAKYGLKKFEELEESRQTHTTDEEGVLYLIRSNRIVGTLDMLNIILDWVDGETTLYVTLEEIYLEYLKNL